MQPSVSALPWLAAPPADFRARCRALPEVGGSVGAAVQLLAGFSLDAAQSAMLRRALARLRAAGRDLAPLAGFRLGVLASATYDLICDCIPAAGARHGLAIDLVTTPYDQVMQQALDPASAINNAGLDAALLAVDHRWLGLDRNCLASPAEERIASAMQNLRALVDALREHGRAAAILATIPCPTEALFGSFDRRVQGTLQAMIDEANRRIIALAEDSGSYLLDVAELAARIGRDRWFDPIQWLAYKLPFSAECFPIYADMLARLIGAIRGKARKCLVLDLDNTIWGGVVGDDGVDGIVIGQGDPVGEAFLSVQRAASDLRERGIVLAVCSKNADEVARRPFRERREMILREADIAVFQANWIDKPANLEAIAKSLNIGLDALVLLDDNPAERAHVRAALPMVAVPELPEDPSLYAWFLFSAGYFESVSYSAEDRLRARSYHSDSRRAEVMAGSRDLGDYLSSLQMTISFAPFDQAGRPRVAQLINKTNQFNLTTRRYSEAELARLEADKSVVTLQARLTDKFGDLGMISVAICRSDPGDATAWTIDSWLMSCRVLGRRVEDAMLAEIVREAKKRGVRQLAGTYLASEKNTMVSDHYRRLGFQEVEPIKTGRRFILNIADFAAPDLPLQTIGID